MITWNWKFQSSKVIFVSETDYFIQMINSLSKTDDSIKMINSLSKTDDFTKTHRFS